MHEESAKCIDRRGPHSGDIEPAYLGLDRSSSKLGPGSPRFAAASSSAANLSNSSFVIVEAGGSIRIRNVAGRFGFNGLEGGVTAKMVA